MMRARYSLKFNDSDPAVARSHKTPNLCDALVALVGKFEAVGLID